MPNTGLDLEIAAGTDDLQFATPTNGWAVVGDGSGEQRVIGTADRGGTWRPVPLPKSAHATRKFVPPNPTMGEI